MTTSQAAQRFLILLGSRRANGNTQGIATWVADHLSTTFPNSEVIQYSENLGPVTSAVIPAGVKSSEEYESQKVQEFSRLVKSASGIVIVTPQYNWSVPGELKHCLDQLFHEWSQKPFLLVTFGGHGGPKALSHLKDIMMGIKAHLVPTTVSITLAGEYIRGSERVDGKHPPNFVTESEETLEKALGELKDIVTEGSA